VPSDADRLLNHGAKYASASLGGAAKAPASEITKPIAMKIMLRIEGARVYSEELTL